MPRYAMLLVVDAEDATAAWESIQTAEDGMADRDEQIMFATGPMRTIDDPYEDVPDPEYDTHLCDLRGTLTLQDSTGRPMLLDRCEDYG